MALEVLTSYTWPTGPVPLAALRVRVDDLAARLGVAVRAWDEDGLGPARGFGGRLPSGCVVLLEELQLAVQHHGAAGPAVYVDASELGTAGPEPLVVELLAALGLARLDLASVADEAAQRSAGELAARVQAARTAYSSLGTGGSAEPGAAAGGGA